MSNKIIIQVEKGLVSSVVTENKDTEVLIVDLDSEGANNDELLKDEEIKEFVKDIKFVSPKKEVSGIRDGNINEFIEYQNN